MRILAEEKEIGGIKSKNLNNYSLTSFIFAFIVVEIYFISPVYFIYKYKKSYMKFKHIPFFQIFFNFFNCSNWVAIALQGEGDFQNFITNIIGVCINLIVIQRFYSSISHKKSHYYKLPIFIIINLVFQFEYILYKFNNEYFSKIVTVVVNVCMYSSINIGVYYGFKEKRADRIPLLSAILGFLSTIGWIFYSIFLNDNYDVTEDITTFLSNVLSILSLITPIICYIYLTKKYGKTYYGYNIKEQGNINIDDKNQNMVELSEKDDLSSSSAN